MKRIIAVVDNAARRGGTLWGEHGLAYWVESGGRPLLFDTGQSGAVLLHNLAALDLDPRALQAVVLSHGHYDHSGGLRALGERVASGLPLYAANDVARERFSRRPEGWRSIGLGTDLEALGEHFRVHLDDAPCQVLPGVWTSGAITERPYPGPSAEGLFVRSGDGYAPDPGGDDQALVVEVTDGLAVVCGCCHAGLLNTLHHAERVFGRPVVVAAGGTHLVGLTPEVLADVGQALAAPGTLRRLYLGHCSGEEAYCVLRQVLGTGVVVPAPAGTVVDLT